jgi:DNA-binding FadR family transcriptional regulator
MQPAGSQIPPRAAHRRRWPRSNHHARDIESLQKCLVRLSRSFIRNQSQPVSEEDAEFRRIIAGGTGNDILVTLLMDQFTASNAMIFEHLEQTRRRA